MSNQDIDEALDELVAAGLAEMKIVIAPDGSSEPHYRLTPAGFEATAHLINRLAAEEDERDGEEETA